MTQAVLSTDIGGTKTSVALVNSDGKVLDHVVAPTPASLGATAIVENFAKLARELHSRNSSTSIVGVAVSATGVVDVESGSIVSSTDTMTDWAGTALSKMVSAEIADLITETTEVLVVNDVEAHANGEYLLGAARGCSSYLVVAVGTGVGSGIVINGRPLRGAHHLGGEIAHVPTPGAEHLRCPCGKMGHLEAIGSGLGIHRHFISLGGNPNVLDARQIVELANQGDSLSLRAITESATAVGKALAGAVALLDPERIVLTGGVVDIGELWWEPMERSFRAELVDVASEIPLFKGELGFEAPLVGVAGLVWQKVQGEN